MKMDGLDCFNCSKTFNTQYLNVATQEETCFQTLRHQQTDVQSYFVQSVCLSAVQFLFWIFLHTGDRRRLPEKQTGPSMR